MVEISWVEVIMTKKFVLYCSETKANYQDMDMLLSMIKVRKSKSNVIYGFTGNLMDLYMLYEPLFNIDLSPKSVCENTSYIEAKMLLIRRFKELMSNFPGLQILSAITGWNGDELETTRFAITKNYNTTNGYEVFTIDNPNDIRTIFLGKDVRHHYNFCNLINRMPSVTILNFKNKFKEALDIGVKFDDSINQTCIFEALKENIFIGI